MCRYNRDGATVRIGGASREEMSMGAIDKDGKIVRLRLSDVFHRFDSVRVRLQVYAHAALNFRFIRSFE